ncbi:hypothetical protein M670_00526 [Schinkia azotoformans MEV2011]|uniref:Uncharacterized protein n=1 Tax=Schinkia azotoformans MEV2011 TaxID=1348973 RepID=A0A072P4U0_SCHAZ|nr:hypothetical protein M670_00526 [Schinkia azotoformans MEV2011]
MAKERKQKKNSGAIHEETKTGYGNKKLEGPNRPAE